MSFTRARLPGFWTFNSAVSPSEFEHIDDYAYAIDGRGGGAYAPSAVITIGGDGLTVSGAFNASNVNVVDVNGSLTIALGATLQLTGNQVVNSGAIVGFTNGSFLTVQSGATLTTNSGSTVNLNGTVKLGNAGPTVIEFSAARSFREPGSIVWVDTGYWGQDSTIPLSWPHRVKQTIATNPSDSTTNLRYEFEVPPGATVVSVDVWIHPASGHGGVPGNRPQLQAYLYDSDAETCVLLGAAVATNASVAAYELRQLLTVTPGAHTIAVPTKLICQVFGEGGAYFVAGLVVDEPTVTFSTAKMRTP